MLMLAMWPRYQPWLASFMGERAHQQGKGWTHTCVNSGTVGAAHAAAEEVGLSTVGCKQHATQALPACTLRGCTDMCAVFLKV